MTDNTQGSQSKPVVLASSLFLATLCVCALYMLYSGPSPDSAFFIFRSGVFFYPISAISALVLGYVAFLGFKRLKTM